VGLPRFARDDNYLRVILRESFTGRTTEENLGIYFLSLRGHSKKAVAISAEGGVFELGLNNIF